MRHIVRSRTNTGRRHGGSSIPVRMWNGQSLGQMPIMGTPVRYVPFLKKRENPSSCNAMTPRTLRWIRGILTWKTMRCFFWIPSAGFSIRWIWRQEGGHLRFPSLVHIGRCVLSSGRLREAAIWLCSFRTMVSVSARLICIHAKCRRSAGSIIPMWQTGRGLCFALFDTGTLYTALVYGAMKF